MSKAKVRLPAIFKLAAKIVKKIWYHAKWWVPVQVQEVYALRGMELFWTTIAHKDTVTKEAATEFLRCRRAGNLNGWDLQVAEEEIYRDYPRGAMVSFTRFLRSCNEMYRRRYNDRISYTARDLLALRAMSPGYVEAAAVPRLIELQAELEKMKLEPEYACPARVDRELGEILARARKRVNGWTPPGYARLARRLAARWEQYQTRLKWAPPIM